MFQVCLDGHAQVGEQNAIWGTRRKFIRCLIFSTAMGFAFALPFCMQFLEFSSQQLCKLFENQTYCFLSWLFSRTGDGLGEGYGMLGQAGSGKLRVSIGQSKLAAKVAKK